MQFAFDNTYARLPRELFARAEPTPVDAPQLIAFNSELAAVLGVDADDYDPADIAQLFAGNRLPRGAEPIAMAYSGHQFGGFSPVLGDGRAILLGEVVGHDGVRRDIQLKGSGPTPFSRRGDGRSALGPVLREYLVSEAMHALGVPTTRALAAVWSGESVFRETPLPGGIFVRVARSHIRVGTFQYLRARDDLDNLRLLLDYSIQRLDPEAADAENPALAFFAGVISRQAQLVAAWMSLGFIHGVMNTDNTSISGETIDYGPCAFLDAYDPAKKFSSIDHGGRYAFHNQPPIAQWNLARLADTLLPLIDDDQEKAIAAAKRELEAYARQLEAAMIDRFAAKIGIASGDDASWSLAESLLQLMHRERADFTRTFRHLADALDGDDERWRGEFADPAAPLEWLDDWRADLRRRGIDLSQASQRIRGANPAVIPRNHRIEEVISAGVEGDFAPFHRMHQALRTPYEERPEDGIYRLAPRPEEEVQATFCGT